MPPARTASVLTAALLVASRVAAMTPVPWTEAGEHVRRLVTIEGVVARATTSTVRRCVLEFDPNDPAALRVVITIPLITDLPADPSRLYQGKRVQVTGRVLRFQERLEMLVTPVQIDVVGLTEAPPAAPPAAPAPVPAPMPPAPASSPPAAVVPAPAPAAPAPTAPASRATPAVTTTPTLPAVTTSLPPPTVTTTLPAPIVDPRCTQWRAQRAAIRDELRGLTEALDECLAANRPDCAALGDRLGPPLSRLAEVEQRLAACP